MVASMPKSGQVNILASQADWAWPQALSNIFQPRGINMLIARDAGEFIDIIGQKRIHTTIIDMDSQKPNGLATVRIIRLQYPLMPCIALTSDPGRDLLDEALELDVFSVIDKPVDMAVLLEQLDRLFVRRYNWEIFR